MPTNALTAWHEFKSSNPRLFDHSTIPTQDPQHPDFTLEDRLSQAFYAGVEYGINAVTQRIRQQVGG